MFCEMILNSLRLLKSAAHFGSIQNLFHILFCNLFINKNLYYFRLWNM